MGTRVLTYAEIKKILDLFKRGTRNMIKLHKELEGMNTIVSIQTVRNTVNIYLDPYYKQGSKLLRSLVERYVLESGDPEEGLEIEKGKPGKPVKKTHEIKFNSVKEKNNTSTFNKSKANFTVEELIKIISILGLYCKTEKDLIEFYACRGLKENSERFYTHYVEVLSFFEYKYAKFTLFLNLILNINIVNPLDIENFILALNESNSAGKDYLGGIFITNHTDYWYDVDLKQYVLREADCPVVPLPEPTFIFKEAKATSTHKLDTFLSGLSDEFKTKIWETLGTEMKELVNSDIDKEISELSLKIEELKRMRK